MLTVRQIVTDLVGRSIKPLAQSSGFKKRGLNFHRRRGDLLQVLNLQLSTFNRAATGGFYINIGIAFDRLMEHDGQAINERLPEYECHFRRRIRDFCPDAPDKWVIDEGTDQQVITNLLAEDFKTVLQELDSITSIPTFLSRSLLHPGTDYGLLARLHYVSGNLSGAWQALGLEAEFFADRQGMSIEHLIGRYHLSQLKTPKI